MKSKAALQGWRAPAIASVGVVAIFAAIVLAPMESQGTVSETSVSEVSVRLRPLLGTISVSGDRIAIRNGATTLFQSKSFSKYQFRFSAEKGGTWTVIADTASGTVPARQVSARKVEIFGESLRVDLRPTPSHIQLVARVGRSPKLDLVGLMSLEDYLEGVVAGEVPRDWPIEALKAQAVAARSFTVAKALERESLGSDWLFEASVQDQVFDHERVHSRATDAVRATEGEVLRADDQLGSKVIAAHYHSDCGGATDEPASIWGGAQIKNGTAKDSSCALKARSSWRYVSDLNDLSKKLHEQGLLPSNFKLASIAVDRRSSGGRALELAVRTSDGREQVFSGERLRAALGYSDLKSTLFNVKVTDTPEAKGRVEFSGRGFGHGTGLCQWGARQLAQDGRNYREILRHYYPRLRLSAESSAKL